MAYPTVTNTFVNGTTADGTKVNTNFTDILNAFSDGSKDLNMSAATLAGAVTINGAITLGNGVGDDLTINGSLTSSLPIKTTHSYDIGSSTLGLRDIFLGSSAGAFTTKISGADVTASKTVKFWGYDVTLPVADGTAGHILQTNGSGTVLYQDIKTPIHINNYSLTAVVDGANGMDVTLKGSNGNDLSATNVCEVMFRNATNGTGTPVLVRITSNITAKIDSGATLGQNNNSAQHTYIYLLNNAGTAELAVSSSIFGEDDVISTTQLSNAADSDNVLYSETARANVPIKRIGHFKSTQATAGTWLTNPATIYLGLYNYPYINFGMTVTGANWTTGRAVGVVYCNEGTWRLTFNIRGDFSVGTSFGTLTVVGVVFGNHDQAMCLQADTAVTPALARVNASAATLSWSLSGACDHLALSGDVELTDKPNWSL